MRKSFIYNGKMKKKGIQKLWGWVHFTYFVIFVTIGKRFKDTGFRDIAVEFAVIEEDLIEVVLEGRQVKPQDYL